jgi:hypothetical protein
LSFNSVRESLPRFRVIWGHFWGQHFENWGHMGM